MLDLHRFRLLHELHARGTIAAVAEALRFTPSAVSQQLAVLEREAGVPLLERAGRGVRLTDAALVLVGHADALLERASVAEAELAAASVSVAGRARIASFQSAAFHLAVPAMKALAATHPTPVRARRGRARAVAPALPLGDVDLVVGDEWQHQPLPPPGRRSTARTCSTTRSSCAPGGSSRRRGGTAAPCRWPSSPTRRGRPATARWAGGRR